MLGKRLGHYQVTGVLGRGGMGDVYEAYDTRLNRPVALKFLPREVTQNAEAMEQFLHEARAASALNHPNIITIHDFGEAEEGRFIVMELISGRTLRVVAAERLPAPALVQILAQAAKALAVAHAAGIAHGDIKPDNIMVRQDGYVKVLDFGLARLARAAKTSSSDLTETLEETLNSASMPGGTMGYLSPEQARGESVSNASDIFSLGIVFYELATRRHPFPASSQIRVLHAILTEGPLPPSRLNPEIPAALEDLILEMLEKDARLRPTAAAVEAALTGHGGDPPVLQAPAPPPGAATRMVGRHKERAELLAGFESAFAGRGSVLCVTGEPGIGKSTLVEEFLAALPATGAGRAWIIARGRCSERLAGAEAYLPFLEALQGLLRRDRTELIARTLKATAPTWYVQLAPFLPEDASLARMTAEARGGSQERTKRELGELLEEITRLRPLVLFFDDFQWADVSTADLLAYIGGKCRSLRLLMVLAYRPTDMLLAKHPFLLLQPEMVAHGACREIRLEFLDRQEIAKYLELEFPENRFPPQFSALIHGKTEGNPLFLVDLLRYLRDRGVIHQQDGRWTLPPSMPDVERDLPASVRSMIQRKIGQLEETDRKLLVGAAVQGYEFDSAVLARALRMEAAEVEERLRALDRVHAFVREIGEEELPDRTLTVRYRFVHVLYLNALYASLTPTRRASLSAAVAGELLGCYGEHNSTAAAGLALLFDAARDFSRASQQYLVAAQNASRIFANQEAVALARRGLELLPTLPDSVAQAQHELALQVTLGPPLTATQGYGSAEVEKTYTRARQLCAQLGGGVPLLRVLFGLWQFYIIRGRLDTSQELAQQMLRLARSEPAPVRLVACLYAVSASLYHLGEILPAYEHVEQAVSLYEANEQSFRSQAGVYDYGVICRAQSTRLLWLLGYPDRALERIRQAYALAQDLHNPMTRAFYLVGVAELQFLRRDTEQTRLGAEAVIAHATEQGLPQPLAWARFYQAWAQSRPGPSDEAVPLMRDSLAALRGMGSELMCAHFLGLLAEVLLGAGRVEEALDAVDEALEVAATTKDRYYLPELHRLRGEVLGALHPSSLEPQACFLQALELSRQCQARSLELRAAMSLSRFLRDRGHQEAALQMLAPVFGWFTEGFDTGDLQDATALLQELR